jgi:exodeoxyribonuclease-3
MKIMTWNVNSIRLRISGLERLITKTSPDIICLQEIKVVSDLFPYEAISDLGYPHQAVDGMKGYNGVAILSRTPLTEVTTQNWCKKRDCRHIFAAVNDKKICGKYGPIGIHNFYVPAGGDIPNPRQNPKFAHKLQFLKETREWFESLKSQRLGMKTNMILVGDLNVAPLETDVWSHKQLSNVVSHTPIEVDALNKLMASGPWLDAVRKIIPPEKSVFSWWSYRSKDWTANNRGRRLDHIWTTTSLEDTIKDISFYTPARSWEKPSDHVPVLMTLSL